MCFKITLSSLLIYGLFFYSLQAQQLEMTPQAVKTLKYISQFERPKAKKAILKALEENPDNYFFHYLDLLNTAITVASQENQTAYLQYTRKADEFIDELENHEAELKGNPLYLFSIGEIYCHKGLIQLKNGDHIAGLRSIRKSYVTLKESRDAFPGFWPNRKYLLAMKAGVGTLPEHFQVVAKIFNVEGNLVDAMEAYDHYLVEIAKNETYEVWHTESQIIYAYLWLHLKNDQQKAWQLIDSATRDFDQNPLKLLIRANTAQKVKKNDEVLKVTQNIEPYNREIPYLSFIKGKAMLYNLDEEAYAHLKQYTHFFNGDNYIKSANLYLSWHYLLNNDLKNYEAAQFLVRHKGAEEIGEDKSALREIDQYYEDNVPLLRARMLFDGGYYDRALDTLLVFEPYFIEDKIEYYYRLGRIYQEQGRTAKALTAYEKILSDEYGIEDYYVPSAYLNAAYIEEENGNKEAAESHYNNCMKFKNHAYKNAFQQKAKAGIKRLKAKE